MPTCLHLRTIAMTRWLMRLALFLLAVHDLIFCRLMQITKLVVREKVAWRQPSYPNCCSSSRWSQRDVPIGQIGRLALFLSRRRMVTLLDMLLRIVHLILTILMAFRHR